MKTLILLILLVSCGEKKTDSSGNPVCMTREEIRALCYVDEMSKLGHDPNMDAWVKDQCARIYAYNGCYTELY